jgi:hypothetical protein
VYDSNLDVFSTYESSMESFLKDSDNNYKNNSNVTNKSIFTNISKSRKNNKVSIMEKYPQLMKGRQENLYPKLNTESYENVNINDANKSVEYLPMSDKNHNDTNMSSVLNHSICVNVNENHSNDGLVDTSKSDIECSAKHHSNDEIKLDTRAESFLNERIVRCETENSSLLENTAMTAISPQINDLSLRRDTNQSKEGTSYEAYMDIFGKYESGLESFLSGIDTKEIKEFDKSPNLRESIHQTTPKYPTNSIHDMQYDMNEFHKSMRMLESSASLLSSFLNDTELIPTSSKKSDACLIDTRVNDVRDPEISPTKKKK